MLGLVGKSGSGKTTLLKCIYGLEDLQEGEVLLDGEKVTGPAFNLIPGHEEMRLVSQDFYVLDYHSVEENIFDKLIGYTNEAKQKRTAKLLKLLDLTALKATKAKFLSSGQKQRVAIARAFAILPKILLLDEPFSNLDKLLTERLFDFILKEVKKQHTSVILITHRAEEALKFTDRVAVLEKGKISQTGKKWNVYYRPKNSRLAGLLGDYNILYQNDLEKKSRNRFKSKTFIRPDKIKLAEKNQTVDLIAIVNNCTFNGKCFEILCETKNKKSLIVYSPQAMNLDCSYNFSIDVYKP